MNSNIILSFLLLFPIFLFGQNQEPCHLGHITEQKMQESAAYAQEIQQFRQNIEQQLSQYQQSRQSSARAVRTVSVVVHVVYNNTAENVSQTYLNNMINTLNADYRKQNSDLGSTRNSYLSVAGDAEIEFCLDQTIRVSTNRSCFDPDTETNDMKFSSSGGSNAVDPKHFLNIWVVNLCGNTGGGVAGYAYMPTQGMVGSTVDGLVIDYQLGFNQGFGRTATHEIGHYLGLQHPWGSDANPSCSVDDGFNDTPNTSGPNYVCTARNSCGTPAPGDMYENFMDYTNCSNMFTQNQVDYMNLVLDTVRFDLLNSNGCSSTPSAPIADFSADKQNICPSQTVNFTDNSSGTVSTWSWEFTGGSPNTSTQQNPSVSYANPGTYTVKLTVSGANGSDVETKTAYITVAASQNLPLVEGFQNTTFPSSGWALINFDNDKTWQRKTNVGGFAQSSACAFVDNFRYNAAGNQDALVTPNYDLSSLSNAYLKYDYAYAYYGNPQYSDSLLIAFTNDCGANYYAIKQFGGADLATRANTTNEFTPSTAADWDRDSIDISFLSGNSNVQFLFININGYGNQLYLDNINIDEVVTNSPPVANFQASSTTVNIGGQVNFTDLSTNLPNAWNWTFTGGTPNASTQQNPTIISYNSVGTYPVSLTATNAFGSDTETKTAYINVVNNTVSSCDTLLNIGLTDTISVYTTAQGGYASGHNGYGEVAKADFFNASSGNLLSEVSYYFAIGKQNAGTATVEAKIWDADGAANAPNTVLASQAIPLSSIVSAAANNLITVVFPVPITLNGDFYSGIEFSYGNGDTVALYTNLNGNTNPGTAWGKSANGTWRNMSVNWNLNYSNVILPVVCQASSGTPPVADFSANRQSACEGTSISFTDLSTNVPNAWNWTFAGGTPSSSTQQNPTVVYNSAGNHEVSLRVTNSDGNDTKTISGYINITAAPSISETLNNLSCNGANDGSITLNISGGSSPYSYAWSNGATSKNISNLNDGNYSVTVTDNNGCVANGTYSVSEPAAIQLSGTTVNADCGQSNGSINVSVSGATAPISYTWSTGANSPSLNNLMAGNYTLTVRDNNNCSNSKTFSISNTGAPSIHLLKSDVHCGGASDGAVRAEVSGGTAPYTFSWSNNGTDSLQENLSAGNYAVTVSDANNCVATANTVVAEPDTLEAIITGSNPSCGDNNGSLSVNPQGGSFPYTQIWSNGQTTANLSNLSAGNYSVTLTDGNNCEVISTYNLNAFHAPSLSLNTTDISCSGNSGSIVSNVSGGEAPYTYAWSNGETTPNLGNLNPGTYVLTVTDNLGCSVSELTIVNSEGPQIDISKNDVLACYGDNSGGISLQMSGGVAPYSFAWSTNQTSSSLAGLYAGTYTVTVTDGANCKVSRSIDILQPDSLEASLFYTDADANLNNGTAYVEVKGGSPAYTFLWSNGSSDSLQTNLAPGNYTVTVSDNFACKAVIPFSVAIVNSISELENAQNWNLYPNPARHTLFVKPVRMPEQAVQIRVYSALGAQLDMEINSQQNAYRIDLSNFSQGVYFLELNYNKQRIMKRFVVTH